VPQSVEQPFPSVHRWFEDSGAPQFDSNGRAIRVKTICVTPTALRLSSHLPWQIDSTIQLSICGVFSAFSMGSSSLSARRKTSGKTEFLSNFVETYAGRLSYRFGSIYLFFIAPRYSCDHITRLEKQEQKCALGPWDLRVETRQGLKPPYQNFLDACLLWEPSVCTRCRHRFRFVRPDHSTRYEMSCLIFRSCRGCPMGRWGQACQASAPIATCLPSR
jgi:hypothetical protein